MRKFSLRVNRLKRVSYGPFNLEQYVPNPNDLVEVKMTPELRKLMYDYYRNRTQEATHLIESTT
jgi:16S rRNA U516 pseudouridylate synthase RsuA-like enzyme